MEPDVKKEFIHIEPKKDFEEYKKFAFNENLMKLAIGFILATALQQVVAGISNYLIMPIVNYFVNRTNGNWRTSIWSPIEGMNIELGHLIGTFVDFFILTIVLYFIYFKIVKRVWPDPTEKKKARIRKNK